MDPSNFHGVGQQGGGERETPLPHYCPAQLLGAFALCMAGHGRCVSTAMMIGDRGYALRQLTAARGLDDPDLAALTARLFAYFDHPLAGAADAELPCGLA